MPQTIDPPSPLTTPDGPSPEQLKLSRRASRSHSLFAPHLVKAALKQAIAMLQPQIQWKNPVMFVVEVGTVLTLLYTVAIVFGYTSQARLGYLVCLDIWLVLTLLFANFASALAEARGKAQADALRQTRRTTPAFRLRADRTIEETVSTELRVGDLVEVTAG